MQTPLYSGPTENILPQTTAELKAELAKIASSLRAAIPEARLGSAVFAESSDAYVLGHLGKRIEQISAHVERLATKIYGCEPCNGEGVDPFTHLRCSSCDGLGVI